MTYRSPTVLDKIELGNRVFYYIWHGYESSEGSLVVALSRPEWIVK